MEVQSHCDSELESLDDTLSENLGTTRSTVFSIGEIGMVNIFSFCSRDVLLKCVQVCRDWNTTLIGEKMKEVWEREYRSGIKNHFRPDFEMIKQSEENVIRKNVLISEEHIKKMRGRLIPTEILVFLTRYIYVVYLPIVCVIAGMHSGYLFLESTIDERGTFELNGTSHFHDRKSFSEQKIRNLDCLEPIFKLVFPSILLVLLLIGLENYYFLQKQRIWRKMAKEFYGIDGPETIIPTVQFFPLYLVFNILFHIMTWVVNYVLIVYFHYRPSHIFIIFCVVTVNTTIRYAILVLFGACFSRIKREIAELSKVRNQIYTPQGEDISDDEDDDDDEYDSYIIYSEDEESNHSNSNHSNSSPKRDEEWDEFVVDEEAIIEEESSVRETCFFRFHESAKVALVLTESSTILIFFLSWMKTTEVFYLIGLQVDVLVVVYICVLSLIMILVLVHGRYCSDDSEKKLVGVISDFSLFLILNMILGWIAMITVLLCSLPLLLQQLQVIDVDPKWAIKIGMCSWAILFLRYPVMYVLSYAFLFERGCFLMEKFWEDYYLVYPIHDYLTLKMTFKYGKDNIPWGKAGYCGDMVGENFIGGDHGAESGMCRRENQGNHNSDDEEEEREFSEYDDDGHDREVKLIEEVTLSNISDILSDDEFFDDIEEEFEGEKVKIE